VLRPLGRYAKARLIERFGADAADPDVLIVAISAAQRI
jgi:hypothetical protein